jgi:hypothetical protein
MDSGEKIRDFQTLRSAYFGEYVVTIYVWLQTGYGLVNRFIKHLQVVTTYIYNTIAYLHILKITGTF